MSVRAIKFVWIFSFFFFLISHAADKKGVDVTMQPCRYSPHSVSRATLAGINLSRGVNLSVLSEVGAVLSGNLSHVPLNFTINLSVINPNPKKVTLTEYEYIILVDNVEFARGTVTKSVKLTASSSRQIPLPISLDLTSFLKGSRSNTVQNLVKNFMGAGSRPTHITLHIKPTYRMGKETFYSSRHIPLSFSFPSAR